MQLMIFFPPPSQTILILFKITLLIYLFLLIYQILGHFLISFSLSPIQSNFHLLIDRFTVRKELYKLSLPPIEKRIEEREEKLKRKILFPERGIVMVQLAQEADKEAEFFIKSNFPIPKNRKILSLSSLEWEDIQRIFKVTELKYQPAFEKDFFPVSKEDFDNFLLSLQKRKIKTNRRFYNDRIEEFFIEPVFWLLCDAFQDVTLTARINFTGKIVPLNSSVDFSLIQSQPQREYFIIEVKKKESKDNNQLLNKALAQCFGAMEAMAEKEKKEKVYGLVTDFSEWRYLEITNEGAHYYSFSPHTVDNFPTEESLKTLILYLYDHMKKTFGNGIMEN